MKISISNLAWERSADVAVSACLTKRGISAIDVVPGRYISDLKNPSRVEADRAREWWQQRDIKIVGMQALLFGTQGLNVFGDHATRAAMLQHLAMVARVAEWLGARCLVFGSPRNRDRSGVSDAAAEKLAVSFFRELGDIAVDAGVLFCLEPNPARYGCNFMTRTQETAAVVRMIGHPGIRMQLDTGAMAINCEDPDQVIPRVADVIGHIHISEPDLVEVGTAQTHHAQIARILAEQPVPKLATIEMKPANANDDIACLDAVDRAVRFTSALYS